MQLFIYVIFEIVTFIQLIFDIVTNVQVMPHTIILWQMTCQSKLQTNHHHRRRRHHPLTVMLLTPLLTPSTPAKSLMTG
jgi:hypothetical protein